MEKKADNFWHEDNDVSRCRKYKKRKAVMEFPAWKYIFSCFHKKYFARCMHPELGGNLLNFLDWFFFGASLIKFIMEASSNWFLRWLINNSKLSITNIGPRNHVYVYLIYINLTELHKNWTLWQLLDDFHYFYSLIKKYKKSPYYGEIRVCCIICLLRCVIVLVNVKHDLVPWKLMFFFHET